MRIYYDLVIWEEVDQNDSEKLKGKMLEMAKRFQGYGVLSFNMRGTPVQQEQTNQQPQPVQYQYQEPEYEEEVQQPQPQQRVVQKQQTQQQPKQVKRQVQEVEEEILDE